MPGDQQEHKAFRQRLDAVLRERDPEALRAFLIAEGQWQPEQQTDTEAAMWMMIAASSALKGMHAEAEHWLLTHGHEAEAGAILGSRRETKAGASGERPAQKRTHGTSQPKRGGPGAGRTAGDRSGGADRRSAAKHPGGAHRGSGSHAKRTR